MTKLIPDGYHTVNTMIVLKNAQKAIDFYKKAFGAKEKALLKDPNGKGVMHAELQIGDSTIMLCDENPQYHAKSVESFGGSPVSFYLYVKDVDSEFKKAIAAGAISNMEVQDMFWGDRMGSVKDPFGYTWALATHIKDLTPEQIAKGAEAAFAHKATR